jgi:hypothetical protein
VYVHASMNDVERSSPESDTVMTTGWSANESLEFDPRPIDTGEQSSTSCQKTIQHTSTVSFSLFIQTLLSIPKKRARPEDTLHCMTHGQNTA